jgi:hypothetical protein
MYLRMAASVAAVVLLTAVSASSSHAQCSDWLRQVALPKLGCAPQDVDEICAGLRPVPTTPYCGGRHAPSSGTGDWCMTPIGGCQLSITAPLNAQCRCASPAGYVNGWVTRQ